MKLIKKKKFSLFIWSIIRGVLITGICFLILHPLLVKISSSLMSVSDVLDPSVIWVPENPSFNSFKIAYEVMDYPEALLNSFSLATIVGVLQLISCTIIGYGFARFKFIGRELFFGLVLLTLVVPPQLISLPLYLNFRFFDFFGLSRSSLNLTNTYWPFILTSITANGFRNGLYIYIIRQFFRGMPRALQESAYVDGAGPLKTFYKIMLPGAVPAMVIVFLFSFVWQWNDYFYTFTFLRRAHFLPTALQSLMVDYQDTADYINIHQYVSVINNAGMIMLLGPLLIVYAFAQRYFIESVARTGIVG